jgi:hypothetical protein
MRELSQKLRLSNLISSCFRTPKPLSRRLHRERGKCPFAEKSRKGIFCIQGLRRKPLEEKLTETGSSNEDNKQLSRFSSRLLSTFVREVGELYSRTEAFAQPSNLGTDLLAAEISLELGDGIEVRPGAQLR